ncbi:translation elongation factor EF-1 alpha [Cadophora gregata]|uniref:translation elongation factor EF-1 alpha n=1 Tax=Cadophora gregata TaxID=51156 RepID=UPI0026DAFEE8|nr:translation elongation factor EF-1 alpha [Cadophora gregata]KAK0102358.1 translation elongation factor EF-1 alpha [Cadophora gregata]KAK0103984.1 translation elongation factor EF-1 alpha [Cadophora gregata f. sp. sojae]
MVSEQKTVLVLGPAGAGKATAIGCILFKFGGIDMLTLERFQKEGIRLCGQAARNLKSPGVQPSFDTPNFHVVVSDGSSKVDCVLLVIPADSAQSHLEKELDIVADAAKQIIVLINKMDDMNWSEVAFQSTVHSLGRVMQGVPVIPFSALRGDNAVELSSETAWYEGPTLLMALETSFRT